MSWETFDIPLDNLPHHLLVTIFYGQDLDEVRSTTPEIGMKYALPGFRGNVYSVPCSALSDEQLEGIYPTLSAAEVRSRMGGINMVLAEDITPIDPFTIPDREVSVYYIPVEGSEPARFLHAPRPYEGVTVIIPDAILTDDQLEHMYNYPIEKIRRSSPFTVEMIPVPADCILPVLAGGWPQGVQQVMESSLPEELRVSYLGREYLDRRTPEQKVEEILARLGQSREDLEELLSLSETLTGNTTLHELLERLNATD